VTHVLGEAARISLLLRRAGFAAGPTDLDHYLNLGWEATLQELLHPERVDEDLDALLTRLQGSLLDLQNIEDVQTWWLYRMVQTRRPLLEKLTLFWHGHFAVANYKVGNPLLMHRHVALLRANSLGRFDDLLLAVSKDPAMLIWLDGATNRRNAPNENYGRELLELYTLGIGNYDEDDVLAAARAFTGWNLRANEFFFDDNQHDAGDKTFMGQSGSFDGGDILKIVANDPAQRSESPRNCSPSSPIPTRSLTSWHHSSTSIKRAATTSAPWLKPSCARTPCTRTGRSSSTSSRLSSTRLARCDSSGRPSASASLSRSCGLWARRF
jgi:hypothetical protein